MACDLSDLTVTRLCACNRVNLPEGTMMRKTVREQYALAYKAQGLTYYTLNGVNYLSDPNHVCFLPKGTLYAFTRVQKGECFMMEFDALLPEGEALPMMSLPLSRPEVFVREFRLAEQALMFHTPASRPAALTSLYRTLTLLCEEKEAVYADKAKKNRLAPAIRYLETHREAVSNEELAALCRISCVYFRKLFTLVYHTSPARYQQAMRIRRAEGLLLGDFGSIADVATACGYGDIYSFSKAFKAVTGLSPTQYKARMPQERGK